MQDKSLNVKVEVQIWYCQC